MNCQQVQDWLLQCEEPRRAAQESRELAEHLDGCGSCRSLVRKLVRLEQAVWELPLPSTMERSRVDFLKQLERRPVVAVRRSALPVWRTPQLWYAAAALVLFALGLGTWLINGGGRDIIEKPEIAEDAQPSDMILAADDDPDDDPPSLVGRLIAWNLDLTQTSSSAERERRFADAADALKEAMDLEYLPEQDRSLAEKLLATASLLAKNDDPVVDADLFDDVADEIVDRMAKAVAKADSQSVARLGKHLNRVAEHGINAKLEKAESSGKLTAERQKRVDKIDRRTDQRVIVLASMLQRAPAESHKQIRRAMEVSQKNKNKGKKRQE